MTAKEKAQELIEKFIKLNSVKISDYSRIEFPTAKQCALIAVEEVIYYLPSVDIYPYFAQKLSPRVKEYWQQVKQEIEKL